MQYPTFIAKYIEKNKVDSTDLSYLITSTDGVIVDIGSSAECLITSPVVGDYLSNYMPVFEGIFPVKEDVYLPNIQLSHSLFFNIHIVVYSDQIWILCQNITESIHKIRQLIEKKKEIKKYEFSLLEALDYYVFKNNKTGEYRPISGAPKWVNKITHNIEERIDIENLFPYLAFFLEQLPKGIIRKETIEHYSGIWTQNTINDSEIHLNAWLFQVLDDTFILVQPVNENKTNEHKIIQSARENTLAYEQLQKTKKELQDLLKLKDQFVSIVSHDFRSPISSLTNGISFLLEDINQSKTFDDSHREIIIQIKQELSRLLEYNNKLYNWTKLSLDSLEINITDVSLDLMVANLNGQYDGRLNEKSIKLVLNVEEQVELKTDYVLLNQVIANLLDNAIKFSKENSEIIIEVNQHSLKLSDSGVGMSTEKIDEILKGYSLKSSNGTNGEPGTGLGLNIVTRIIHALNFKLNIESELGKGTTFTITFN